MIPAPLPPDEPGRLRALQLYQVLDTVSERAYDELTELAARICGTPIGLVSLVDDQRQWFKARVGLEASETPREVAFCAHAILQDEVMVVEDAQADLRFAGNPLVTGEPGIRFYAGSPLRTPSGHAVGTLCVIDRSPRSLSADQRSALEALGRVVVSHLELRRALADLEALRSLLPMCAWCRSIHREDGTWVPLDAYVAEVLPLTHGICPSCRKDFRRQPGD